MSVIGSNILAGASGQGGGYNLTNSLRFRSSASAGLSRTFGTPTNQKIWTYSAWYKRGTLTGDQGAFIGNNNGTSQWYFRLPSNNTLEIGDYNNNIISTTPVLRDPSSWYHLVLAIDTTQATATNRIKLYLNGVQQSYSQGGSFPAQNSNPPLNQASLPVFIGNGSGFTGFDGYLTEVNFIDGQALTPSSFGETSPSTGVWQPKRYAGTYGTNGFYLPFTSNVTYYSGLFNGSSQTAYVNYNSVLNLGTTDYTIEAFVNPTSLSNGNGQQQVLGRWVDGSNARSYLLTVNNDGSVTWSVSTNGLSGSGNSTSVSSSAGVVTTNTWTHIRISQSGGTVYVGVNGTIVTTATNAIFNNVYTSTDPVALGASQQGNTATLWTGRISNVRIIKGTALSTSSYTVPTAPLTAISGTSLLTLQSSTLVDNSGNSLTITNPSSNPSISTVAPTSFGGLGKDFSSNGNNWTTNNISLTAGSTYDSMTDVPTLTSATAANFAVVNPLKSFSTGALTITNGNLSVSSTTNDSRQALGTIGFNTGKFYWEATILAEVSNFDFFIGLADETTASGNSTSGFGSYRGTGLIRNFAGTSQTAGNTYTVNDVIGVAVDADAGTVQFYKNGSAQGATPSFTFTANSLVYPSFFIDNNVGTRTLAANFGQRPFAYTPPTGFVALNTFNLPTPTIGATASTQANKYMDINLWTGNDTSQTITNSGGFQPDFVWIKQRSSTNFNQLVDVVRGNTKYLYSNNSELEETITTRLTAFNSNGFSLGSSVTVNSLGSSYVGWQWDAGTTTVTNTSGTISSQVRANTSSGFSVVTYTGNATSGATVGHGLGVAPSMMIVKNRTTDGYSWYVYHVTQGATKFFEGLNTTDAVKTGSSIWNNTAPTSSVFSVGSWGGVNESAVSFVAYCFSEIAGYSKFGSYSGITGSADSSFIYTGFKPAFLLIKRTDSTGFWVMLDNKRKTYNVNDAVLYANSSNAEATGQSIDFLSNGFKLRTTDSDVNTSGNYVYAAFSENPFKYSLAE